MRPMLLQYISEGNASKSGIKIRGDAVLNGQHTFYLTLEAADTDKVQEFISPFALMGSVEIWPANTCEVVVDRGHC